MNIYVNSSKDAIGILIWISLFHSLLISTVLFVIYYTVEKQKSYKGLLILKDENDIRIYDELGQEHDSKYVYKKLKPKPARTEITSTDTMSLDEGVVLFGYIILIYSIILGFFPEIFYIKLSMLNIYLVIAIFVTRLLPFLITYNLLEKKNRKDNGWWILGFFLFPAMTLILAGSLYPLKKEDSINEEQQNEN